MTSMKRTTRTWVSKRNYQHHSFGSDGKRNTVIVASTKEEVRESEETTINVPSLNPLLDTIAPSKTVEIFSLVKEMQSNGIDVTSLCVGEPDFLPPQPVLDSVVHAIQDGQTKYTALTGTADLRKAIANDLQRRKGVSYDPLTEIIVGNGAKQCVYQAILAVCGDGDKVIVPAPYWPSYPEMVKLCGAHPIIVPTQAEKGYLLTPEELRSTIEAQDDPSNIKMIIVCNPSNPTGSVYNREQLQQLATVLEEYPQISILADEIYERLVYPTEQQEQQQDPNDICPSFASIPNMFHRTCTINGFSKAYAMTGMRLGYVAAPKPIAKAITTIQSQFTSCAGSISQAAGVAALTQVSDDVLEENVRIMKEKRDYVLQQLATIPHVHVHVPPNGAFYVMPDVSHYCTTIDDTELCLQLLQSQQLALVPGSSFGAPGTVRISYATSLEELEIAMNKLRQFLSTRE